MHAPANVRIHPDTYQKLRRLAKEAGEPLGETLAAAVEALYRKRFLAEANAAYARLKSDPKAWKKYQQERGGWEKTLADGMEGG